MRIGRVMLLVFLATGAIAQQYVETVEIQLHNLDAVVTDKEGHPVTGLTKDDFVLLENGVPQEITNFSSYESSSATMAIGEPAANAPAANISAAAPPARRFVFFIDEMAIQTAARNSLRKNALELVHTLRPDDLAAIVRPGGAAKMVQEYTSDSASVERALGKAIDDCKMRLTAPAFRELQAFRRALETAETANEVAAAKRAYMDAARARVEQRLSQIRALITSMASSPGKKVLVLITSGLSSQPGREVYSMDEQIGIFEAPKDDSDDGAAAGAPAGPLAQLKADAKEEAKSRSATGWGGMERIRAGDYRAQIDDLARTAAAEGVTIYALEPEVPLFLDATRGADSETVGSTLGGGHAGAKEVVPPEFLDQLLSHEAQTLTSFAEKTGGRWFRGVGEIEDTFRQVTSDLQAYYSLAYRPRGDDAKPRKIAVAVKNRPDLQVRTRSEVIAHSAAGDMSERVLAGLLYQDDTNDLKMTAHAELPKKKGRSWEVPVEIVIPVNNITFTRDVNGKYVARVSVHYATAREEREFVAYGRQEQRIELTEKQYADLANIRYRYKSMIPVPKGHIRIALGVLDTGSKLSSMRTLSVIAQ
jgi:VWFA-related protein